MGVPDTVLGEELCAYVIVKDGEQITVEEVQAYCKENLAAYKVPKYVHVLDCDFPRNAPGKILKKEMKKWVLDGPAKGACQ